jgi:hypothetical protein
VVSSWVKAALLGANTVSMLLRSVATSAGLPPAVLFTLVTAHLRIRSAAVI